MDQAQCFIPNAHNGLMNIITKHPRDSEGMSYVFSSGSSSYTSKDFDMQKHIKG